MNPNKKTKSNDWYMKIDPPIWITADFDCSNKPVNDPQRKTLFINKPVEVGYNIVKKSILWKPKIGTTWIL